MKQWEAALIVLYDAGPEKPGPGYWCQYTTVANVILHRQLCHTRARQFSQNIGQAMRVYGGALIENAAGKTGGHRIRERDKAAEHLKQEGLWVFTREGQKALEMRLQHSLETNESVESNKTDEGNGAREQRRPSTNKKRSGESTARKKAIRVPLIPEEIIDAGEYFEGATQAVSLNRYERNLKAKQACIRHFKCKCSVCSFSFDSMYGDEGKGYIQVHHLKQIANCGGRYKLNPLRDLRPICPNCHAMIHRRNPPHTIQQLKRIIRLTTKAANLTGDGQHSAPAR